MSRVPYEVHRARKRAGHSRVGSETLTETEFDFDGASSLASYSTHVTSSSYRPSSSSRAYGYEDSNDYRQRTLSPSSPQFQHTSPYPISSSYPNPNPSLPSRRYVNGSEADHSRPSSSSLLPETSRRNSRPGETDEERRARREKRRAERHGTEKDEVKRALRSSYKAKIKQEREEIEESKYGSPLRKFVKWSMAGGGDGSRSKGLSWGLGSVALLRVAIIGYRGIQEWRAHSSKATPTASSDGVGKSFFSQSQVRRAHDPALILEIFTLWSGVVIWSKMEGRRQGRSWRTQMTGILTILLQPALLSIGLDPSLGVKLGLAVWALIYFTKSQDVRACIVISLLFGLSGPTETLGWSLIPGLSYFVLGKAVWIGGSKGLSHGLMLLLVGVAVVAALHLATHLTSGWDLSVVTGGIRDWVVPHAPYGEIMAGFEESLRSFPHKLKIHWVKYLAILITQLPTLAVMLYTSISTRTTPTTTPILSEESAAVNAPITNILPLSLLTSSIPLYLLLPSSSTGTTSPEIIFTLLPLTLMMCLRGDDDIWNVGVMMSNVATFKLRHTFLSGSNILASPLSAVAILGWNYSIGHSPRRLKDDPWLRRSAYLLYASISTVYLIEFLGQIGLRWNLGSILTISPILRISTLESYLISISLWATWLWSIKKLLETAWAIGGFAGSGLDSEKEKKEPRIVVQAPEAEGT